MFETELALVANDTTHDLDCQLIFANCANWHPLKKSFSHTQRAQVEFHRKNTENNETTNFTNLH